jgi:hypothetical protein
LFYHCRAKLADFYSFAADSVAAWTGQIRALARRLAPDRIVVLGRDEWMRVPTQQRGVADGQLDYVNWHQWHYEGAMFNEYVLNRVKGVPCCGQEMGVLPYKDQQDRERLDEQDCAWQLERKLMYCLGNWIQWQSFCDPMMHAYKETKLGMVRVDGAERALAEPVRLLAWLEKEMAPRLTGRREDTEGVLLVVPTSLWFSSDRDMAYRAVSQANHALHAHLKARACGILESLLRPEHREQMGHAQLVIVPSATVLSQPAWEMLLALAREDGATVLITGSVEQDEFWRRCSRMETIGVQCRVENLAGIERLRLEGEEHTLTYRMAINYGTPGKGLLRAMPVDPDRQSAGALRGAPTSHAVCGLTEITLGAGRVLYCPLPVELADDIDATVALYRQVIARYAPAEPMAQAPTPGNVTPAQFVYVLEYADMTTVTMVNEGAETTIDFALADKARIGIGLSKGRGAKLYLDAAGDLLGGYIHGQLEVGGCSIAPGGDLSFVRGQGGWKVLPGRRTGECVMGGRPVEQIPAWTECFVADAP